ncbi:MAG: CHC2 zinc finger domain-containing protein [Clostridiales bacterium]|nr:CHC2 zinc finger domain-containing protein [Clostridiales bacterium]
MNLFEAVKQSVTTRQAAETYGIRVGRNGMCVCPFHNDRNPSMKVDRRFHCFGCQADGDVIDFASRFFGLSGREAAEKLAADFMIHYEISGISRSRASPQPAKRKISEELRFRNAEQRCFRVYSDYLHLLEEWKVKYAPEPGDEDWHPLFAEALEKQSYVEYLLDTLLFGTVEDRAALVAAKGKEVMQLERRLSGPSSCGEGGTVPGTGCDGAGDGRGGDPGNAGVQQRWACKKQPA